MRMARFLGVDNRPVTFNPEDVSFVSSVSMNDPKGAGKGAVVAALGVAGIRLKGVNQPIPVKGSVGSVTDELDDALAGRTGQGAFAEAAAEVERRLGGDDASPLVAPGS